MIRTVISLDEDDKLWLDQHAARLRTTMTQLVRLAVRRLRSEEERLDVPFDELLERTRGIWPAGDGLAYQRSVRRGWGAGR